MYLIAKNFFYQDDTVFDPVEDSCRQNGLTHKEAIRGKEIQKMKKTNAPVPRHEAWPHGPLRPCQ
jgi:hypothetical protein